MLVTFDTNRVENIFSVVLRLLLNGPRRKHFFTLSCVHVETDPCPRSPADLQRSKKKGATPNKMVVKPFIITIIIWKGKAIPVTGRAGL
jgi:hypothetical protein